MSTPFGNAVDFICPFCEGKATVFDNGVIHVEPSCEIFKDNEPEDYLFAVNSKYGFHETPPS